MSKRPRLCQGRSAVALAPRAASGDGEETALRFLTLASDHGPPTFTVSMSPVGRRFLSSGEEGRGSDCCSLGGGAFYVPVGQGVSNLAWGCRWGLQRGLITGRLC